MTAYGSAHHDPSQGFLEDLHDKCQSSVLPLVLGGGFNMIRKAADKSSGNINYNLMDNFNNFITTNELMEIKRGGPRFTWTNKQSSPIIVELDMILVSTSSEARFPLCTVFSLTRVGSDHYPIVLNTGGMM